MKQETLIGMVYDFMSLLVSRIPLGRIRGVYLFGSVARGDFDESSDIDVFVDTSYQIEKDVQDALKSFGTTQRVKWHPKQVKQDIKVVCGNLTSETWKELLGEIQDHGIMLFGNAQPEQDKNHLLVAYTCAGLKTKDKMKLIRELYGYSTKKQGTLYSHKGFVDSIQGIKLGTNVFLVPTTARKEIEKILSGKKVKYQIRKVAF